MVRRVVRCKVCKEIIRFERLNDKDLDKELKEKWSTCEICIKIRNNIQKDE